MKLTCSLVDYHKERSTTVKFNSHPLPPCLLEGFLVRQLLKKTRFELRNRVKNALGLVKMNHIYPSFHFHSKTTLVVNI